MEKRRKVARSWGRTSSNPTRIDLWINIDPKSVQQRRCVFLEPNSLPSHHLVLPAGICQGVTSPTLNEVAAEDLE